VALGGKLGRPFFFFFFFFFFFGLLGLFGAFATLKLGIAASETAAPTAPHSTNPLHCDHAGLLLINSGTVPGVPAGRTAPPFPQVRCMFHFMAHPTSIVKC
jgi:hypothetical protein